jgi:hypothetical protein
MPKFKIQNFSNCPKVIAALVAAAFVARHNMGTCIVGFKGCLFLNFVGGRN